MTIGTASVPLRFGLKDRANGADRFLGSSQPLLCHDVAFQCSCILGLIDAVALLRYDLTMNPVTGILRTLFDGVVWGRSME